MNVATVRRLLRLSKQTVTIQRRTPGGEDPYGNDVPGAYATLTSGALCQVSPARGRGEIWTENEALVKNLHEFYFAADEDIREDDQLTDLAFAGTIVNAHIFEIDQILKEEFYYRLVIAREVI